MRIALVTETYPPEVNGVASTVARFVDGLRALDHHVLVVRPKQKCDQAAPSGNISPRSSTLLCTSLPIPRYPQLRMGLPAGRKLIESWLSWRPDIVHIATEGPLGWSALRAARQLKLPISSEFRTNFHTYSSHYGLGSLRRPILGYLRGFHNATQTTLVPTEELRKSLSQQQFVNVQVVARGVDAELFHPRRRSLALRRSWHAGQNALVVIYVGRLAAEKNVALAFKAFNANHSRCADARMVIVGDGPARASLQARFPSAIFTGLRTGEDLAAHYASADLFLFPSTTETFGNVTIEAMASGLAMVAFNYAAAATHISHGDSGLLADYRNEEHFVALAVGLANSAVRIASMGQSARRATESIGWHVLARRLETVLLATASRASSVGSSAEESIAAKAAHSA